MKLLLISKICVLLTCAVVTQSDLGRKLADMHKAGKSSKGFGFDVDNTIGRYNSFLL